MTKGLRRIYIFSALFILFMIQAGFTQENVFEIPRRIEKNIDFWVKIFSFYADSQVVIHDSENLDIIYDVITLDNYSDHNISFHKKWEKVEDVKKEYCDILKKLSKYNSLVDPKSLTDKERFVFYLWQGIDKPKKYNIAMENIRGQKGLKNRFKEGIIRSGRYMHEIEKIFEKYNLPVELGYLPHVESSFNHTAYSKMGASGLWQFTRGTGRLFMKVNSIIDERSDPFHSTDAAARLLKKNYEELGSWPLAITAYNHGLAGMKRAQAQLNTSDFGVIYDEYKSRSFGFASRNFYAEFIAATQVAQNYKELFGELTFDPPIEIQRFVIPDYVYLSTLANCFGIDKNVLIEYNPGFRSRIRASRRCIPKGYTMNLPIVDQFDPAALYAQLGKTTKSKKQIAGDVYSIQPGDNLASIAKRSGTTIDELLVYNDITDPDLIKIGQILEIPNQHNNPQKSNLADNKQQKSQNEEANQPDVQVAQRNILPSEAGRSKQTLPVVAITDTSYLRNAVDSLVWNFNLDFAPPDNDRIIVEPDETLGHFAEWLDVSAQTLRQLNHLHLNQNIRVGQRLKLTFDNVESQKFHERRIEYHKTIQTRFFNSYKFLGYQKYNIKNGDNVWKLCYQKFNIPCWLLYHTNKDKDLDKLQPGEIISIPKIASLEPRRQNLEAD